MPVTPSPPGSSQSSAKHKDGVKKKKKSWSLEGKNKKGAKKSRAQIKEMLLGKERIKEEDLDAPPNSDAKDESLRIFEQQQFMAEKEEYVSKQPQIAIKRKVKKKGKGGVRRAETLRPLRKRNSSAVLSKHASREDAPASGGVDTSLFKERASANNSNANSPENSDRFRERDRRRAAAARRKREECTQQDPEQTAGTESGTGARDGDSIPLALEPEPTLTLRKAPTMMSSKRTPVEKAAPSRLQPISDSSPSEVVPRRPSLPRTARSVMGMPTTSSFVQKPKQRPPPSGPSTEEAPQSTQLALEPEPDLDRVRRQKEAAFMKRFLTALKLLPKAAPRPVSPAPPRSEDSPSDSSKRQPRNFKQQHFNHRKK
ncbi:hypothetical protein PFISCL1PPCAC_28331 [Pristionchus fissidentatus]|uniref:Uncharacterized protein n=1 Tax=Pristionchus fissidentatus TaxID=1538716 RepID=A0AAV5X1S1_9BILA|nr:hypothetical protein PFISCL1PPCAC_22572 [Pristionchus fissidentatus]GMT37034.1 hypothetical protein PFISCL1PPCAC_28331 [Pristionchus fissidentatus]